MFENYALQLFAFLHQVPWWVYGVVFLAALFEALPVVGTIVPGHTIVILAGMLLAQGGLSAMLLVLAAVVGAVIGDGISYFVGRRHGERLFKRWPRALPIIKKSKEFFAKYGAMSVIIGRFSAITRSFVPVIAGSSRMKQSVFWTANVIGGILWGASSILVGYLLGTGYLLVHKNIGLYTFVIVIVAILFWFAYARMASLLMQHPKKAIFTLSATMIALFAVLFDALTDSDSSWTASILRIDHVVHDFALAHVHWSWTIITQFGGAIILLMVIMAMIILFRKRRHDLALFIGTVAVGYMLEVLFKAAAGRLRPDQLSGLGDSFPSGHTLMATVVYGTLFVILWRSPRWRWNGALWSLPIIVLLVGWSRVMVDAHWLSDVIGGLFLGVGIVAGMLFLQQFAHQWLVKKRKC